MTMTSEKMGRQSSTSGSTEVQVETTGLDVSQIKAIQLSDGWHNITNPRFVQFAVGEAHSPLTPSKLFPSIRYTNQWGQVCFTPLGSILSYSEQTYNGSGSGYSPNSGNNPS